MDPLFTTMLEKLGAPGAILLVCFYALRRLHDQHTEIQAQRVADSQAVTGKLLEMAARNNEHISLLARATDGVADAMREQRILIEAAFNARQGTVPNPERVERVERLGVDRRPVPPVTRR